MSSENKWQAVHQVKDSAFHGPAPADALDLNFFPVICVTRVVIPPNYTICQVGFNLKSSGFSLSKPITGEAHTLVILYYFYLLCECRYVQKQLVLRNYRSYAKIKNKIIMAHISSEYCVIDCTLERHKSSLNPIQSLTQQMLKQWRKHIFEVAW